MNKVFDAVSVKDASVKLAENKKDIIFTCAFYENPIFVGRFWFIFLKRLNSNILGYTLVSAKVTDTEPLKVTNVLLATSIDTGVKIDKNKIVPVCFVLSDRAGYKPFVWDYVGQFNNYLVELGDGASGKFSGTFYYLLKKRWSLFYKIASVE